MTETFVNFIISYFQGFFGSFIVLLLVYLLIWKFFAKQLGKWKIQQTQRAGWDQIKTEIINSFWVTLAGTVITITVLSLKDLGRLKFYTDINSYGGIGYLFASFVFLLVFGDAWFYLFHRLMHHPKIYKYVHSVHHKSLEVTPFTVSSFHFIEAVVLGCWIIPVAFFVPIYIPMLGVMQFIGLFNNIKSHLGYELYPKWFQKTWLKYLITSTHHNIHHTRYNGNYGLMFTFWDVVCGTDFKETDTVFNEVRSRKNGVIKMNTKYFPLKISKIVKETEDVRSVYFESVSKDFSDYFPGQYLNVRMKIDGKNHDRIFSLSSSPVKDKFLRITMKLNGVFTHHIFNKAKPGDVIEALLPCGDFYIKPNPLHSINYLMIAGGSGVTPLYSMIRSILQTESNSTVTLFYSNKSPETKIFADEINLLIQTFRNFKVVDFYSGVARLSQKDIQNFIDSNQNPQIYTCGPTSLKSAVKKYLREIKIDESISHDEEFVEGYARLFSV
jgi:ferredoxin-NADP reductase/sterol desaturase/sphingolipid hydroxylase (fatty acid hydroxylase superfamily)